MNFKESVFGSTKCSVNPSQKIPKLSDFDLDISSFSKEKALLESLVDIKSQDNWSSVRNSGELELRQKIIEPIGARNFYYSENRDLIRTIQMSRGTSIDDNESIESYIDKILASYVQINSANILRINELQATLAKIQENFSNLIQLVEKESEQKALKSALVNAKFDYYEIGFRCPSLLSDYKKLGYEVSGCDINTLNVNICKKLGWNVFEKDIMHDTNYEFSPGSLVGCYQVLGNVSDPCTAIKNIVKNAPPGVKFHFEVAIEPGVPNLRYCRMFPFEPGDLKEFITLAGLIPISFSNVHHPEGPPVERILAVSK